MRGSGGRELPSEVYKKIKELLKNVLDSDDINIIMKE